MTKKNFVALANTLRVTKPSRNLEGHFRQWEDDVHALADFCAAQNPRFNRARWLAYINGECGASGGKVKP